MIFLRALGRVLTYLAIGSCLALAESNLPPTDHQATVSWLERLVKIPIPQFPSFVPSLPAATSNCAVPGLATVWEPGAAALEASVGTVAVIDISGLTEATASALAHLEQLVASIGGRLELKSAYRPVAYQEHLQSVWDKWHELRRNRQEGCRALRAEVSDEFKRHNLLESQRPVTDSDHTRGVGIDAAMFLPAGARWKRHRISLDRLAKMVGFGRPDVRHDPVHFRLLASAMPPSPETRAETP